MASDAAAGAKVVMPFLDCLLPVSAIWRPGRHGRELKKKVESAESYKRRVGLYTRAVPGMHRAGPGERGGAPYGRRTVATAERAAIQVSEVGKGLKPLPPAGDLNARPFRPSRPSAGRRTPPRALPDPPDASPGPPKHKDQSYSLLLVTICPLLLPTAHGRSASRRRCSGNAVR